MMQKKSLDSVIIEGSEDSCSELLSNVQRMKLLWGHKSRDVLEGLIYLVK